MIECTKNQRVVRLSINNPPVNIMNGAVLEELHQKLTELSHDESVAACLIRGEGKCFSAGASVEEHRKEQAPGMLAALYEVCRAISRMPFPTVALVHGSCLGGALEVISFCDFVVADPAAQFGVPEISLAFFPPIACSTFPEITGRQNASYLILTGEMIDAEAARAMGLVQKIVARDEWETVEKRFNNTSLPVARLARKAIMNASARFREQELESLRDLFISELYDFEDVDEGIASFGEKRKPVWKHR